MDKHDILAQIFRKLDLLNKSMPVVQKGVAFAPSNIALVKYWGKSNPVLNIPVTDSLSISLGDLGAHTEISALDASHERDDVTLNGEQIAATTDFYKRITEFLGLFRAAIGIKTFYSIKSTTNIPVAAGLASSACGFAALVLALNNLYGWHLDEKYLSILARLGSGSAARSLWQGFVYWQRGSDKDGMDCHAYKLCNIWPELTVGLLLISQEKKPVSSREAMLSTVNSSVLYRAWPEQVDRDMKIVLEAIRQKNISLLGETAENNALAMHATMLSSKPAICYSTVKTIQAMHDIWQLRKQGVEVYFTQDAGPNLKLLFNKKYCQQIISKFPELVVVNNHF